MLQAWTEICNQSFGDSEVKTMWKLQKNVWCIRRCIFLPKNVYKWVKHGFATTRQSMEWKETDSPAKKKVPGAVVNKVGHADSLQEYEKKSLKKVQLLTMLLIFNSFGKKISLFIHIYQPLHRSRMWHKVISKWSSTSLNSELSFP